MRKKLKTFLQDLLPIKNDPLIVASMGRSGSTVLTKSLQVSSAKSYFPIFKNLGQKVISENAWDLKTTKFRNGVIYKTHCLADELNDVNNIKVIFVYGSAIDSALSVLRCKEKYGQTWIDLHFQHLRAKGNIEDIKKFDVLRFEEQIKGWRSKENLQRLIIKYDSLWKYEKDISDFVGFDFKMEKRKSRPNYKIINPIDFEELKENYSNLEKYIQNLPDIEILS